jgi:hypothetical protein
MAKRSFTAVERHAVFTLHSEKCYVCSHPLTLKTMEVDHVIPETLADDPERLLQVLTALGRAADFNLQSYENWLPACSPCNGKKGDMVWEPSLLVQQALQRAKQKADACAALASKTVSERKVYNALNVLERASESGQLPDEVLDALEKYQRTVRDPQHMAEPVRVSPRYELHQVLKDDGYIRTVRGLLAWELDRQATRALMRAAERAAISTSMGPVVSAAA